MRLEKEELNKILNTKLVYRDSLDLPSNVSFGIEIESDRVSYNKIKEKLREKNINWSFQYDSSIYTEAEADSLILKDSKTTWQELKTVCALLKQSHAKITPYTGGHVHVGTHIFHDDIESLKIFLETYMIYEPLLFRFWYVFDSKLSRKFIK